MVEVARYRCTLLGFQGAPGLNTWHVAGAAGEALDVTILDYFQTTLKAIYDNLSGYRVEECRVLMPDVVDIHDAATGELLRRQGGLTPGVSQGQPGTSITSRATQAKLQLHTNKVINNRNVRGGPFYGPLGDLAMTSDGSISSEFRAIVPLEFEAVMNGGPAGPYGLAVWHQPVNDAGGSVHVASSISVNQLPAVIRRRRQ